MPEGIDTQLENSIRSCSLKCQDGCYSCRSRIRIRTRASPRSQTPQTFSFSDHSDLEKTPDFIIRRKPIRSEGLQKHDDIATGNLEEMAEAIESELETSIRSCSLKCQDGCYACRSRIGLGHAYPQPALTARHQKASTSATTETWTKHRISSSAESRSGQRIPKT